MAWVSGTRDSCPTDATRAAGAAPHLLPPRHASRTETCRVYRGALAALSALVVCASLLTLTATPAAGVPPLPPNTSCEATAVIAKLSVAEDRAAASMLAEALRNLAKNGDRCLLDAGDHTSGNAPAATRREAARAIEVYVVGGPGAIPDAWLQSALGVDAWVRIGGANRWATQTSVVEAIIRLEGGEPVEAYVTAAPSVPMLPPNTGCDDVAVMAKLGMVEDRAAANMLATALSALTIAGTRCLIDVGDPGTGMVPSTSAVSDAVRAGGIYVVGGTTAIPDAWLERHFGDIRPRRVAGANRWETHAQVAAQIVELAKQFRQQSGPQAFGE